MIARACYIHTYNKSDDYIIAAIIKTTAVNYIISYYYYYYFYLYVITIIVLFLFVRIDEFLCTIAAVPLNNASDKRTIGPGLTGIRTIVRVRGPIIAR